MGGPDETDLERASRLWDKTAREREANPVQGWLDSPIVLESYVQPRVSGSPTVNWLFALVERLGIPPTARWISLGCGSAGLEIVAAKSALFGSLKALDSSPASLELARAAAAKEGVTSIEFDIADLNRLRLPAGSCDVVLMNMSLHHVKELRYLLAQIHSALTPGGFLLINEFIGPRQFQFTDLQLSLVRELLSAIPDFWKRDSATGGIKTEYVRMPVEDPSEAIRSDRIIEEVEKRFQVVERKDYGGTILNLLLEHVIHNFDPSDEKDVAVIRLLGTVEELLIRNRIIPSDFTVVAARKKSLFPLGGLRSRASG
jgi:ubiquinone/menaquinone biosynthesis C-methylase UbiE